MEEGKKLISIAGITATVYLVIRYLLPYVIPFLFAYVLVHILNPAVESIRKKLPWKKSVITAILLSLILGILILGFYYISCLLTEQIQKIALNFETYYKGFYRTVDRCCVLAERAFGMQVDEVRSFVYTSLDDAAEQIKVYIVPGVFNYSVRYLKKMVRAGLFLLILFVAVILLMKDYDEMKEQLQKYNLYKHAHSITQRMWRQGGMYAKAQVSIMGIVTILCVAGLCLLGNPYFLILGIVIGVTDVLPFIGTGTVLFPMAVFFLFRRNFKLAAGYLILFLATYVLREVLEPRMLGEKLGIYPFVLVIAVYTGIYLYGAAGVVLGPVTLLTVIEIWKELHDKD